MNLPMEFARPVLLCGLALIPLVLSFSLRKSLAPLSQAQRTLALLLRAAFLSLLLLCLSGPRWIREAEQVAIIFALDQSASISPEAAAQAESYIANTAATLRPGDRVGVVGFAARPTLLHPPSEPHSLRAPLAHPFPPAESRATQIAAALRFSHSLFPEGFHRRIVLLSDGNESHPDALNAAQSLASSGVQIHAVPLQNPDHPEALVKAVETPRRIKPGEPFNLSATLYANRTAEARLKLYQNQFLLETRRIQLQPGLQKFHANNLRAEGSFSLFEVEIETDADTRPENNRSQSVTCLRGEPSVLLVEGDQPRAQPLAQALQREQIRVQTRSPLGLPRSLEELQPFDLLILSDVSSLAIGHETMDLYRRWVQQFGGGFLMLGGENSFGVGGYFRTPVEQMLPVRMEHEDRQEIPSVALLLVLDRSGSMSASVRGQTKMALANQGAALALGVLQPRDYFGVLAVDTRAHTVAPLQQHPTKGPTEQKILAVTPGGGGIYIYTSLAEAAQILREAPARIKHLILFSDAADAEEKNAGDMNDGSRGSGSALELASALSASRISTSVVALGSEADKDTPFLRELAERGNGRFYLTSDATSLPQIFTTETLKVAQSSLVEEPFLPVPASPHPALHGINWSQAPLLLGYNSTKPKPAAEILLATERGEPLLALWRYGLGQAAAFTSDAKGRWASEWLQWPGYSQFWTQLTRSLLRQTEEATLQVQTSTAPGQVQLQIDALTQDGAFQNRAPLQISALPAQSGSAPPFQTRTEQTAPGTYTASIPLPETGTTLVRISGDQKTPVSYEFGFVQAVPEEFLQLQPNTALLSAVAQAGSGFLSPNPSQVASPPSLPIPNSTDLIPALLAAALCLFPIDLWIRRTPWGRTPPPPPQPQL
jgi:Ca-activated chloride channel family protein